MYIKLKSVYIRIRAYRLGLRQIRQTPTEFYSSDLFEAMSK